MFRWTWLMLVTGFLACSDSSKEQNQRKAEEVPSREDRTLSLEKVSFQNTPVTNNGQAIFPLELYDIKTEADFKLARRMGFNATIGPKGQLLPLCETHNFYLTDANWVSWHTDSIAFQENLTSHPLLISVNLQDEPDLRRHAIFPADLIRFAEYVHSAGEMKSSITLAGIEDVNRFWPEYEPAMDIIRVDPYPLVEGLGFELIDTLIGSAKRLGQKPVISILQGWAVNDMPFPSESEILHMVWRSLIAGSNGISYYSLNRGLWGQHPDFIKAIVHINDFASKVAEFLTSPNRFVWQLEGPIQACEWQHPGTGEKVLLITNTSRDTTPVVQIPNEFAMEGHSLIRIGHTYRTFPVVAGQTKYQVGPLECIAFVPFDFEFTLWEDDMLEAFPQGEEVASNDQPSYPSWDAQAIEPWSLSNDVEMDLNTAWNAIPINNAIKVRRNKYTGVSDDGVEATYRFGLRNDSLFWLGQCRVEHWLRREAKSTDRYYVGDDVANLYYTSDRGVRCRLTMNSHMLLRKYLGDQDKLGRKVSMNGSTSEWNHHAWEFIVRVALKDLNISSLEQANLNAGYAYSIAPRQWLVLNPEH